MARFVEPTRLPWNDVLSNVKLLRPGQGTTYVSPDSNIWWSPAGLAAAPPLLEDPPVDHNIIPDGYTVDDALRSRWYWNSAPYLPFVPVNIGVCYRGYLFTRLQPNLVWVQKLGDDKYRILEGILRLWLQLEASLDSVITTLSRAFRSSLPPDFKLLPSPSACGYANIHSRPREAFVASHQARAVFNVMIGTISYLISLSGVPTAGNNYTDTKLPWAMHFHNAGANPTFLEQLAKSCLADMSGRIKRRGVCVDPSLCSWAHTVRSLDAFGVPVWLCWGSAQSPRRPLHSNVFAFYPHQIDIAQAAATSIQQQAPETK
ncbi:hypothetical protein OE88DRAFT_1739408 [Heliocybe sulcata]|uniref:Uncharacterized protein n=1 Tax=Heliocybe sulcata TaxID=5364 RepID=A0A5C3MYG7_9AGAM|nr:hypothetical protein OE88DRAFT_1739408 [Heliocybe sulcata]